MIEGSGLVAAAKRRIFTAVSGVLVGGVKNRVFAAVEEAARWLAEELQRAGVEGPEPARIGEEVACLRAVAAA